jgi:hypothetical protein
VSYLCAWEKQPGIHSCSIHQLEEFNGNRRDKGKKGVLVNTPTLSWAYTRTLKERGKEEIRDIEVLPIQWDDFYLGEK